MSESEAPLWRYIPMHEYSRPAGPPTEAVRSRMVRIWQAMLSRSQPKKNKMQQGKLHSPSPAMLDEAVLQPDWRAPLSALDEAVEHLTAGDARKPSLQVIVSPPYSGTEHVLAHWAERHEWRVVTPPTAGYILGGGVDWPAPHSGEEPCLLVIPQLERFYLRHYNGLLLIRRLLDWLGSAPCRCLIGCNSWTWAYLERAVQIGSIVPAPLAPAPLDGDRLREWLAGLARRSEERPFTFRLANDGKPLFPEQDEEKAETTDGNDLKEKDEKSGSHRGSNVFLSHVAAYCRGIPGIAWAVFRHSLRLAPDKSSDDDKAKTIDAAPSTALYATPWTQLDLPSVPSDLSAPCLFVLHTVLLHGTVSQDLLARLLSFSPIEILHVVNRLRTEGLLQMESDGLGVTPLAYPAVRRYIEDEGYPADAF